MKLFINIFFCLLAGLLVYGAPEKYSYEYCLIILIVFIISAVFYFATNRSSTGNAANFDFFFIFSYGMTNFIYPVFYKPFNSNVSVFELPFNNNVINKSTAIAYLGFTFFVLGISVYKKIKICAGLKKEEKPNFEVRPLFLRLIFIVGMVSFIGYIATGGLAELQKAYSGVDGDLNTVGVFSYFNNIFVICANLLAIFVFLVKDKFTKIITFGFIAVCSLLMLTTGSRTLVLGLGLILIGSYGRFVGRIPIFRMIFFLLIGSFFMAFVQMSRGTEFSNDSWASQAGKNVVIESPLDIFMDMIMNNRNLYVLTDFADKFGNVFFLNAVSDITSPIPGLFSYILNLTNLPQEVLSGGALPTFLEFGPRSDWGLGTNLVGEAYVGFSYFGVCIIMFLLGYLVKKTYQNSAKNIYAFVMYSLLLSHAIFFPRAFYLYQPRTVVWSFIIIYSLTLLTNSLYKTRKKRIPNNSEV